jgi:hypothetical protein
LVGVLPSDEGRLGYEPGLRPEFGRRIATSVARISTIKAAAGRLTPLVKGDLAVIVSESLPKDITHFAQAIVEAFIGMQEDLNEERRTAERRWSKREKQI